MEHGVHRLEVCGAMWWDTSGRRMIRVIAFTFALTYAALLAVSALSVIPGHFTDFATYYAAAAALHARPAANIYDRYALDLVLGASRDCHPQVGSLIYLYPPFLAVLLEPLTTLPCGAAERIWLLANVGLWLAATALLAWELRRVWPRQPELASLLAVVAMAVSVPILSGFGIGQVHILVLVGFLLAFRLIAGGRPWLAGFVLGTITLIQVYPALLLVFAAIRGRWRVLAGAGVAIALAAALMLACASASTLRMFGDILSHGLGNVLSPNNEALASLPGIGPLLVAVIAVAFISTLVVTRRSGRDDVGYAWALCTILLVSPIVFRFALAWVIPAFVPCLRVAHDWIGRRWWFPLVPAILYAATALPLPRLVTTPATIAVWIASGLIFLASAGIDLPPLSRYTHPAGCAASNAAISSRPTNTANSRSNSRVSPGPMCSSVPSSRSFARPSV